MTCFRLPRAALAVIVSLALTPTVACAVPDTWTEGTPARPFSGASGPAVDLTTVGGDPQISLAWVQTVRASGLDARSVQWLPGDQLLVAGGWQRAVQVVSGSGVSAVPHIGPDWRPWSAQRIFSGPQAGNMVVTDRNSDTASGRVVEVGPDGSEVWTFAKNDRPPPLPGRPDTWDPFSATRLDDATTLISDAKNGGRQVIRVRREDKSVVWRFGLDSPGAGGDFDPRHAELTSGGGVLITDASTTRARVVEVGPAGSVTWSWNIPRDPDRPTLEPSPSCAVRLPDGRTVVTDETLGCCFIVSRDGSFERYAVAGAGSQTTSSIRGVAVSGSGSFAVAENGGAGRVIAIGRSPEGSFTSGALDLGAAGRDKRILSVSWAAATSSPGSIVELQYSLNGGPFVSAGTSGSRTLPAGTLAKWVAYRAVLRPGSDDRAPVVQDVSIGYDLDTASGTGAASGSGSGSGTGTGSGNASGPGTGSGTGSAAAAVGTAGAVTLTDLGGADVPLRGRLMQTVGGQSGGGAGGSGGPGFGATITKRGASATGLLLLASIYACGLGWTPLCRIAASTALSLRAT